MKGNAIVYCYILIYLMPIELYLTFDKKKYIQHICQFYIVFKWKDIVVSIFWLQLLLAQIAVVVVGCPVAVALRAAALLVEQPIKAYEIQTFAFS